MNYVTLTESELLVANLVASLRNVKSLIRGSENPHTKNKGWNLGIEGTIAEVAAAKFLNMYWSAHVDNFDGPDLGEDIQVRSTNYSNGGMIVRQSDKENEKFILVITKIDSPQYEIVGWETGKFAKTREFWQPPNQNGGSYFMVPQHRLRDMSNFNKGLGIFDSRD